MQPTWSICIKTSFRKTGTNYKIIAQLLKSQACQYIQVFELKKKKKGGGKKEKAGVPQYFYI